MDDDRRSAGVGSRGALMLLLDDAQLEKRRAAARGPLASLYDSLAAELEPLLRSPWHIPHAKALLSRVGGRCETDGTPLEFDPWSPSAHRCPRCGRAHTGELHDRAWIMPYQLWLAERAVHAALFFVLRGDERHAALARGILTGYADRYLTFPNRDNVLGPTRLFFSTYLESIWLLQICLAADLLRTAGEHETAARIADGIAAPSSALIAEFDEGMSNRQVWNNAALLAAAALREDHAAFERLLSGPSGLHAHLRHALLSDGTWYEGENYHLFALRGLWYGVTMAESRGCQLPRAERERFHAAFRAPFVTALPDFTMPSRKDSQYAVSLRQWRIAELAELGYQRSGDALLAGALARCYEPGHARHETGRSRSTADVERNVAASALTRADLGWRALLHAVPELPALTAIAPRSALLEGQGYAVFRRDADVYVGFEFGQTGGGHGHPDRLNLVLSRGATRRLDDLGTGSYVDPSLHWYRSTLAHNAPLVNGRSQPLHAGQLVAYDEREAIGWIVGTFVVDDVVLERAVVVTPDYLVDELRWRSARVARVELPVHAQAEPRAGGLRPGVMDGGDRPEDGFSFVRDVQCAALVENGPGWMIGPGASERSSEHVALLFAEQRATVFTAMGPGQPPSSLRRFHVLRSDARKGAFRAVHSWTGEVNVHRDADSGVMTVECRSGESHRHRRDEHGWHVELAAGGARSSIDLSGFRAASRQQVDEPRSSPRAPLHVRRSESAPAGWHTDMSASQRSAFLAFELGESHYRRSEQSWNEAGSPRASILLAADAAHLVLLVRVDAGDAAFAPADATNPLDNEHADTMRAGVQLYLRAAEESGGWMLVPEPETDTVRVRAISGWGTSFAPSARWRRRDEGYELRIEVPLRAGGEGELPLDLDLIVNETTTERVRRRGQLLMSGGSGEFVYLRGDRHDPARLLPLVIVR